MELYQLKSFLAVVRTGSLSKAAVLRNISLPGISKHIRMLEEQFGCRLFTRSTRGMELTDKGKQILPVAKRIDQEMDNLTSLARQAPPLRVGFNIGPDFIELLQLKQLLEQHRADSKITLTNHNSGVLLSHLEKGELDLCLAFGKVPEHLRTLPVRRVQLMLMVPVTLAEHLTDLSRACWIVNTDGCPFKEPLDSFLQAHGISPQSTILAQDLSRKELVAQGLGIGFLEPQDGISLLRKGLAIRHGDAFLEVPLWVVYRDPAFGEDAKRLQCYIQERYDSIKPWRSAGATPHRQAGPVP